MRWHSFGCFLALTSVLPAGCHNTKADGAEKPAAARPEAPAESPGSQPGPEALPPAAPGPDSTDSVSPPPKRDCTAPGDGSRPGYHAAAGHAWLMDCSPVLEREYWRVFDGGNGKAFIIPRPDGSSTVASVCEGNDALAELLRRYTLCGGRANVGVINSIPHADALAIAHGLHEHLRFEAKDYGVAPFAIPSDIRDACDAKLGSGAFTGVCGSVDSDNEAAIEYNDEQKQAIAAALNRLYGIDP